MQQKISLEEVVELLYPSFRGVTIQLLTSKRAFGDGLSFKIHDHLSLEILPSADDSGLLCRLVYDMRRDNHVL